MGKGLFFLLAALILGFFALTGYTTQASNQRELDQAKAIQELAAALTAQAQAMTVQAETTTEVIRAQAQKERLDLLFYCLIVGSLIAQIIVMAIILVMAIRTIHELKRYLPTPETYHQLQPGATLMVWPQHADRREYVRKP